MHGACFSILVVSIGARVALMKIFYEGKNIRMPMLALPNFCSTGFFSCHSRSLSLFCFVLNCVANLSRVKRTFPTMLSVRAPRSCSLCATTARTQTRPPCRRCPPSWWAGSATTWAVASMGLGAVGTTIEAAAAAVE